MTMREHLAKTYPLHFQRIVECIWEQNILDVALFLSSRQCDLTHAFIWGYTSEGHDYWAALSRAEGDYVHNH